MFTIGLDAQQSRQRIRRGRCHDTKDRGFPRRKPGCPLNGSRVLFGAGWVVIVLTVAPDLYLMLREADALSPVSGLSEGQSEAVYVVGLALLGPLVLWLTGSP